MYKLLTLAVTILLLGACSSSDAPQQPVSASSTKVTLVPGTQTAVRSVVERFGEQMQKVSTLAPPAAMHQQLLSVYGRLLSPQLLDTWQAHPDRVVGREVSSPWPERIEVKQVNCESTDACQVTGQVDYLTSNELANGGVFSRRPITLKVGRVGPDWRITAVHLASAQRAGNDAAR